MKTMKDLVEDEISFYCLDFTRMCLQCDVFKKFGYKKIMMHPFITEQVEELKETAYPINKENVENSNEKLIKFSINKAINDAYICYCEVSQVYFFLVSIHFVWDVLHR